MPYRFASVPDAVQLCRDAGFGVYADRIVPDPVPINWPPGCHAPAAVAWIDDNYRLQRSESNDPLVKRYLGKLERALGLTAQGSPPKA